MFDFVPIFFQRGFLILTGLVTLFFITQTLSPEDQGIYYTFGSLISAYNIIELGLPYLILQVAPNYLPFKRDINSASGSVFLRSIERYVFFKSFIVFFLFLIFGSIYLHYFYLKDFSQWVWFWFLGSFAASVAIWTNAKLALEESIGNIKLPYNLRSLCIFVGSIFIWIALYSKYFLIGPSIIILITFLSALLFIPNKTKFANLFNKSTKYINWKSKIFSLQKNVAYGMSANYIYYFTPALILYPHDTVYAGKFGLSVVLASSMVAVSASIMQSKISYLTHLFKKGDVRNSNLVFLNSYALSNVLYIVILFIFYLFYCYFLPEYITSRLLYPKDLLILFCSFFMMNSAYMLVYFFRARTTDNFSKYYFLNILLMFLVQVVSTSSENLSIFLNVQILFMFAPFIYSVFFIINLFKFKDIK